MVSEDIWLYKKNVQIKKGFGGFIEGEFVDLYRIEKSGWIVKSTSDSLQVFVSNSETDELLSNLNLKHIKKAVWLWIKRDMIKTKTKIKRTRTKRPWRLMKC